MKLSEEERNTIVKLQMEKAHLFLQQAEEMYIGDQVKTPKPPMISLTIQ